MSLEVLAEENSHEWLLFRPRQTVDALEAFLVGMEILRISQRRLVLDRRLEGRRRPQQRAAAEEHREPERQSACEPARLSPPPATPSVAA